MKSSKKNETAASAKEETMSCVAFRQIVQRLLHGQFQPGEALNENRLATELGVNRTAVHDAVLQLAAMNFLEYTPYSGYRLKGVTLRDILEWYELRLAVEPVAARLCAERFVPRYRDEFQKILEQEQMCLKQKDILGSIRCDDAFHMKLVEHSENSHFIAMYSRAYLGLHASMRFDAAMFMAADGGDGGYFDGFFPRSASEDGLLTNQQGTHESHRELFEAIACGDAGRAELLAKAHVTHIINQMKNHLMQMALARYPKKEAQGERGSSLLAELMAANLKDIPHSTES